MGPKCRWLIVLSLLTGVMGGARAQMLGAQGIQSFTNTTGGYSSANYTLGWRFTVSQPIVVTHLGLWDANGDGLVQSHDIGLWTNSGSLIVSATIPSGSSTPTTPAPGGVWRWVTLPTPATLSAGSYRIGAFYPTNSGDLLVFNSSSGVVTGPNVVFNHAAYNGGSSLAFPGTNSSIQTGYFGPNFMYVPEPSLLQLPFFVSLGGFGWWLRRRCTA